MFPLSLLRGNEISQKSKLKSLDATAVCPASRKSIEERSKEKLIIIYFEIDWDRCSLYLYCTTRR